MKIKKDATSHLRRIFTFAGLVLVTIGCLANIYGASTSLRFIHDPLDLIYYFRYVLLLGGGFAAGYLLTKKSSKYSQSHIGVVYATLAMSFYWLFDFARIGFQDLFTEFTYPFAKILFMGLPIVAIILVVVVAYWSQYRSQRSNVSSFEKLLIILSFATNQLYNLVVSSSSLILDLANRTSDAFVWMTAIAYLTSPIVITIVSYLLLARLKNHTDRLFYATITGVFYSTFASVLWEFRTDASYEATNIFSMIVTILAVIFVGILLWRARKLSK